MPAELKGDDWGAVQFMIGELQRRELTEHYVAAIGQWDLVVRLFRRIELERLFEQELTEENLKLHEAQLHMLIGIGLFLLFRVKGIDDWQLSGFGIERKNLLAYVQELQETLITWHGAELEPARKAELEKSIFGDVAG